MKTLISMGVIAILLPACWKTDWFRPEGDWYATQTFFYNYEINSVKSYVAVHFTDGDASADGRSLFVEYSENTSADSVGYIPTAKANASTIINAVFDGERRSECNAGASIIMKVNFYDRVTGEFKTRISFTFSFAEI